MSRHGNFRDDRRARKFRESVIPPHENHLPGAGNAIRNQYHGDCRLCGAAVVPGESWAVAVARTRTGTVWAKLCEPCYGAGRAPELVALYRAAGRPGPPAR